jgi:uncharacterized protein YjbJ (UPF0337 family)
VFVNFDEIKGKFKEWKGELKTKWGNLTDDDWTEIGGEKDKLIGKIQQRYGRSKEDAQREVDDFWRDKEEEERQAS